MRVNSVTTYIVNQGIASGTSPGPAQNVVQCTCYSFQADITAAAGLAGTFKLQGRIGARGWSDIPNSSQAISANGSILLSDANVGYDAARLVMTVTGGTATVNADFRKKEPSA